MLARTARVNRHLNTAISHGKYGTREQGFKKVAFAMCLPIQLVYSLSATSMADVPMVHLFSAFICIGN